MTNREKFSEKFDTAFPYKNEEQMEFNKKWKLIRKNSNHASNTQMYKFLYYSMMNTIHVCTFF